MAKNNNTAEYCPYIVCYIDILGQSERLKKLDAVPITNQLSEVFYENLRQTYGVVRDVYKFYKEFFEAYELFDEKDPNYNALSPSQKLQYRSFKVGKLYFKLVSDTIIMYVPTINNMKEHNLRSLFGLLTANAAMMILSFANGVALRGGIEIGLAADFPDIGFYGPVLQKAYRLESKIAQYPRIVIGDGIINYLLDHAQNNTNDIPNMIRKNIARECQTFFCKDKDEFIILDFLGKNMYSAIADKIKRIDSSLIEKGFDFVSKERERFELAKDDKLKSRYAMLKEYYANRINNWKV